MFHYRVGIISSPCAGRKMAEYMLREPLRIGNEAMARYYTGVALEPEPELEVRPGAIGHTAARVVIGELEYEDAVDELVRVYHEVGHRSNDMDAVRERLQDGLDNEISYLQRKIDDANWTRWGLPEPAGAFPHAVRDVVLGHREFDEAADDLIRTWIELGHPVDDLSNVQAHLTNELSKAVLEAETKIDTADHGGTIARVRPDLPREIADKIGINLDRPISVDEIANLLNGLRANGDAIEGKQIQSPMAALTEVFGLDGKHNPLPEHIDNIVGGMRVDGTEPVKANGEAFSAAAVAGARKRFLSIYGAGDGEVTPEQVELIKQGRTINGGYVDRGDYFRKINATKAPVAYIDMVWSPDKSLSVAWALAKTEAERNIIHDIHRNAVNQAMAYAEETLGFRRMGKEGKDGVERGKLVWLLVDHGTARPTAEIEATDPEGQRYTEFQDVPMNLPDMQLHTHVIVVNAVFCESGKVGAIDLDLLDGKVKEFGHIYQAFVGRGMRENGMEMEVDRKTGSARLKNVPEHAVDYFSKRSKEAEIAAKAFAQEAGMDWDTLAGAAKLKLLRKGVEATRNAKIEGGDRSYFAEWREMAETVLGYHHESVLHTAPVRDEHERDMRRQRTYEMTQDKVADLFSRRSKISGQELRDIVAAGLVANGIENPAEDIAAVTLGYRKYGVKDQEGNLTALVMGKDAPIRGKDRWSVTTEFHESTEKELLALARAARADRSMALPQWLLDKHIGRFLAANPKVDQSGDHWKAQRAAAYAVGMGGKLDGMIGCAGSGKTTVLAPIVAAWKEEGRRVYGIALAHKHASLLRGAGIDDNKRTAFAKFMKRVEKGIYKMDEKSVVLIDEFGLIAKKDFLDLMRLQKQHGFEVKFAGDPKQCQAVEAGPIMHMLIKAFGEDAFPEISSTIRQKAEREREIAGLFRDGEAARALAMKRDDGTAKLVAGGKQKTVVEVAKVWRETTEANAHRPDFTLTVTAPTNTDVLEIGSAIRQQAREMGGVGADELTILIKPTSEDPEASIPLAVGDKVRLFDRIMLPDKTVLGDNSDVVEIVSFSPYGFVARSEDGVEGLVKWAKIRADLPYDDPRRQPEKAWHGGEKPVAYNGPVKLTYGYARTINSTQGMTSSINIDAMPNGTSSVQAYTGYVAESRHVEKSIMIINEAAERKQIRSTIPHGDFREIREDEVWENISANLSRQPEKASALDFIAVARDLRRGTVMDFQRAMEPLERTRNAGRSVNGYGLSRNEREMERGVQRSGLTEKIRDLQREIADRFLSDRKGREGQGGDEISRV